MTPDRVTSPPLEEHLALLGLSAEATRLYRSLIDGPTRHGPAGTGSAAARQELIDSGLAAEAPAAWSDSPAPVLFPLPPTAALELLTRRQEMRLEEARSGIAMAFDRHRRSMPPGPNDGIVEVVDGDAAIERRLEELRNSAEHETRMFDSPPYFRDTARATRTATDLLARGVRHRVVYSQAALTHPGKLDGNILPCVEAGEEARVLPALPVKLTLIDDQAALVSLPIATVDVNHVLLVVRPGALLAALSELFALAWDTALPLHGGQGAAQRLSPTERRILAMLAAGVPDAQIIRRLGISRRTFFRRMEILMAQTGATSRFQLALHAIRRGWL
ncbi:MULTISPECIES: LuxR C-terminal-related transcriptional regulator [unclassified Streptomyces]|uniref:helix-turn-helix transcriptional regulator n=1 Tax=unclassified Streptomyces TaxID=2593676 RepID=UPI0036E33FA2